MIVLSICPNPDFEASSACFAIFFTAWNYCFYPSVTLAVWIHWSVSKYCYTTGSNSENVAVRKIAKEFININPNWEQPPVSKLGHYFVWDVILEILTLHHELGLSKSLCLRISLKLDLTRPGGCGDMLVLSHTELHWLLIVVHLMWSTTTNTSSTTRTTPQFYLRSLNLW